MHYYRTTGLMLTQMQELVRRVSQELTEPWRKRLGRPKSCGLYHAVEIACMYIRHNSPQEFLGDLRGISQPTISRIITKLVPVVKAVLEEFVPAAEDAIEVVKGRVCLVDGTITPCWSYDGRDDLWSRKHGTTGFNSQLVCLLDGDGVYISDPLPGNTHDATAYATTPVATLSATRLAESVTKATREPVSSHRVRNRRAGNLASGTRNATLKYRHCGPLSSEPSRTSSHGGYSMPTTADRTTPIAKRTMQDVDCSSSH